MSAGNHREAPYPTAGVDILSGAGPVSGDRTSEQRSATLIKAQIGLGRVRLDLLTQEMAEAILGPGTPGNLRDAHTHSMQARVRSRMGPNLWCC